MLDTVKTLDSPSDDPLIITAPALASAREQRRLLAEARKRAVHLVEQASKAAQATHAAAHREGYLYGLSHAVGDIAQWLVGAHGAGQRLRSEVQQQLYGLFESLMAEGDWPRHRLEQWLATQPQAAQQALQVMLPAALSGQAGAWRTHLDHCWEGPVKVELHDQDRFLFCLGDQVLELDVPGAAGAQARHLTNTLPGLADEAARLDAESLQTLRQWFDALLKELAPGEPA